MIEREFITKGFTAAVSIINGIAKIAEAQNHHPDIHLTGYKKLKVQLTTHDAGGLTDNDFKQAALINELVDRLPQS